MLQTKNIAKALADETRLRLFMAASDEVCLTILNDLIDLAPSTISKHLNILYQAGLLQCRKDGRWIFYRQATDNTDEKIIQIITWTRQSLKSCPQIQQDKKRLLKIGNPMLLKNGSPLVALLSNLPSTNEVSQ